MNSKIRKIGGKLEEDFLTLKRDIEYINDYLFELFVVLRLEKDLDLVIQLLNNHLRGLKDAFIDNVMRQINAGLIGKDKFLSPKLMNGRDNLTPAEREKAEQRDQGNIHRKLKFQYNAIYKRYCKERGLFHLETRHHPNALVIFRDALFVNQSLIEIDVDKFIKLYKDYTAANESMTRTLHQQAADAMNRFFNGVPINEKELSRYFCIEHGFIMVKPKSVNLENYTRLGARCKK